MNPFAEPDDLEAVWRTLTDTETQTVAAWMDVASQMIRDEVPDVGGLSVDERIVAGTLDAQTVRDVVVAMVRRIVVLNPIGARSQTAGPFSTTLDTSISASEMHITARELARLAGRKATGSRAFTIALGPGPVFERRHGWF